MLQEPTRTIVHAIPSAPVGLMQAIVDVVAAELPVAISTAQRMQRSDSYAELQQHAVTIYRMSLDAYHQLLPDLVDQLLRWIESVDGTDVTLDSWCVDVTP